MLQIYNENPHALPFLFETGKPEPHGDTDDQPSPNRPPTGEQEGDVSGLEDIDPTGATDTSEVGLPDPDENDPPMIIYGGG